LLQLRLDAVVLNILLIACFDHRSHRSFAFAEVCSAVIAVNVDPPIRCSSGSSIAFNMFGVSFWFFPSYLFNRYRSPVAGVAPSSRRVRHGRCRARVVQQSVRFVPPIDAPHRCDHGGTLAVAVDLTGGEKSPVRAVVAVVNAGGRG